MEIFNDSRIAHLCINSDRRIIRGYPSVVCSSCRGGNNFFIGHSEKEEINEMLWEKYATPDSKRRARIFQVTGESFGVFELEVNGVSYTKEQLSLCWLIGNFRNVVWHEDKDGTMRGYSKIDNKRNWELTGNFKRFREKLVAQQSDYMEGKYDND